MTARLPMTTVPEPKVDREAGIEGIPELVRVVNQNFAKIRDTIERSIISGGLIADGSITLAMLSTAAKTLAGDVTGLTTANTVTKIRGKTVDAPGAGQDALLLAYNHANADFDWVDAMRDVFTTRGDLLYRGASAESRLGIGAANTVLKSDATDPSWSTITALLDAVFSSSQGAVLYRGAAAWSALAPGTSGHFLKTLGAGADPAWASTSAGSSPLTTKGDLYTYTTVDARLPVGGTNGHVLTVDSGEAAGIKWAAAASAGTNALLDGSTHTDTAAGTVVRGDLIYGNSTPKWARMALGGAGKVVKSDGTDLAWAYHRCLRHNKTFFVSAYATGAGGVTNNAGTITAAGGTPAAAADTERPSNKYTQSVNTGTSGFGSWAKLVSGAMSPCLTADFKIVTASKMNLQIGFTDGGGLTANSDTTNVVTLEWKEGTDTNFRFKHNDGAGGVTDDDTTVAKDTSWHDVMIWSPDAGTTWKCEIDGVERGSATTEIPASSTLLNPLAGYGCDGAGSTGNELRQSYVNVQTGKPLDS